MNASVTTPVTATLVAEAERLDFLPAHFGRHFMQVERAIYAWMGELCATYRGGYWEFMSLSNGGGYLGLSEEEWRVSVDGNGFSRTLSADATATSGGEDDSIQLSRSLIADMNELPNGLWVARRGQGAIHLPL